MIGGVAWADVAMLAVLSFTTWRGYARGFVSELAGIVALVASIVVPWYYNGVLDVPIHNATGMALPIAHLAGMAICGVGAYLVVIVAAGFFGRIKKVPVLGFGNALAGAAVGLLKGSILVWLVLFVGLFFPLTPQIRASLHASAIAPYFVGYDPTIDRAIESTIPPFFRPLAMPFFKRHHV